MLVADQNVRKVAWCALRQYDALREFDDARVAEFTACSDVPRTREGMTPSQAYVQVFTTLHVLYQIDVLDEPTIAAARDYLSIPRHALTLGFAPTVPTGPDVDETAALVVFVVFFAVWVALIVAASVFGRVR